MFAVTEIHNRVTRWDDGAFSGDPEIAAFAAEAARLELPVAVFGQEVVAGRDTPLQAVAAMFAFSGGAAAYVIDGTEGAFDDLSTDPEVQAQLAAERAEN